MESIRRLFQKNSQKSNTTTTETPCLPEVPENAHTFLPLEETPSAANDTLTNSSERINQWLDTISQTYNYTLVIVVCMVGLIFLNLHLPLLVVGFTVVIAVSQVFLTSSEKPAPLPIFMKNENQKVDEASSAPHAIKTSLTVLLIGCQYGIGGALIGLGAGMVSTGFLAPLGVALIILGALKMVDTARKQYNKVEREIAKIEKATSVPPAVKTKTPNSQQEQVSRNALMDSCKPVFTTSIDSSDNSQPTVGVNNSPPLVPQPTV